MNELRRWWSSLEQRERLLVAAALLLTGLTLLQFGVRSIGREFDSLRDDVAVRHAAVALAQQLAAAPSRHAGSEPVLAVADRAARSSGLGASLKRLSQDDGGRVRVRLEGVPFGAFAHWLGLVQGASGARIEALLIARGTLPGVVDVTLTLAPY